MSEKLQAAELLSEEYVLHAHPSVLREIFTGLTRAAHAELQARGTDWSSDLWIRVTVEAAPHREELD